MVGYQRHEYWPDDEHGRPTGHHPLCELYEPPVPNESRGKDEAKMTTEAEIVPALVALPVTEVAFSTTARGATRLLGLRIPYDTEYEGSNVFADLIIGERLSISANLESWSRGLDPQMVVPDRATITVRVRGNPSCAVSAQLVLQPDKTEPSK